MRRLPRAIPAVVLFTLLTGCGALDWDEARGHIGENVEVCGPTMSVVHDTTASGDDVTFINVGADYPDPNRFTFVLFDTKLNYNPDSDVQTCGTGTISTYRGVTQMKTDSVTSMDPDNPPPGPGQ